MILLLDKVPTRRLEGKVLDDPGSPEDKGRHRYKCQQRCLDGSAEHFGDGPVDDLWKGQLAVTPKVFTNTVVDNHRVIDGVAAAEFTRYLGAVLSDIRDILL